MSPYVPNQGYVPDREADLRAALQKLKAERDALRAEVGRQAALAQRYGDGLVRVGELLQWRVGEILPRHIVDAVAAEAAAEGIEMGDGAAYRLAYAACRAALSRDGDNQ